MEYYKGIFSGKGGFNAVDMICIFPSLGCN